MNNHNEEFREIVGHLKNIIEANRSLGFDPPSLSPATLKYLDRGLQKSYRGSDLSRINSLKQLREFIGDCKRCKLSGSRTNLVFGEGSSGAGVVFIGEGPGREEDLEGKPFVGEAGELLTKIIENGMGLTRRDVYICNVVKCRPPGKHDPEKNEVKACMPFLEKQLEIIRPGIICILGRIAGQALLGKDFKITRDRGKKYSFMGIPVIPTFHPAYIIRNPSKELERKGLVWKDIKNIMKYLGLEVKKNV